MLQRQLYFTPHWVRCRSLASVAWDDAKKGPVSPDTLAGIPWAGRSTLPTLMHRVATHGPKDPSVWHKMVKRADMIAHSFTAKQAALLLTAMVRARHQNDVFLRRFCVKFVPSLAASADVLNLCGMISGLSQLNAYSEETFNLLARRSVESVAQMDAKQISLVANAFARMGHVDYELFRCLLKQVPRRLKQFTCREAAVLLNALAQIVKEEEAHRSVEWQQHLNVVALHIPELLPSADLHSLTLILNAFAQLRFLQKDVLDLVVEELVSDRKRFERMSVQQLAMTMNATAKLMIYEASLIEMLVAQVRRKGRELNAQALSVIANASAKLSLGADTFSVLYGQVPRLLRLLSGRQLAMICHAWAKAHVHNDDLFMLLATPLSAKVGELTAHEVAISLYGYAHFRQDNPQVFGSLLQHFDVLLSKGKVLNGDLLMLANALGKVGWNHEPVADALRALAERDAGAVLLSPQTRLTFKMDVDGAPLDDSAQSTASH